MESCEPELDFISAFRSADPRNSKEALGSPEFFEGLDAWLLPATGLVLVTVIRRLQNTVSLIVSSINRYENIQEDHRVDDIKGNCEQKLQQKLTQSGPDNTHQVEYRAAENHHYEYWRENNYLWYKISINGARQEYWIDIP